MKYILTTVSFLLTFSFSAEANSFNNHLQDLEITVTGCSLTKNPYLGYYCSDSWSDTPDCPSAFKDSISCYKANIIDIINTSSNNRKIRTSKLKLSALVNSCDAFQNSHQARMECYTNGVSLLSSKRTTRRNLSSALLSACTISATSGYSCLMQAMRHLPQTQNLDTKLCNNMNSAHRKESCLISLWKRALN